MRDNTVGAAVTVLDGCVRGSAKGEKLKLVEACTYLHLYNADCLFLNKKWFETYFI